MPALMVDDPLQEQDRAVEQAVEVYAVVKARPLPAQKCRQHCRPGHKMRLGERGKHLQNLNICVMIVVDLVTKRASK